MPVEQPLRLELIHEPLVHRQHQRRTHAGVAKQHVLLVVVAQHQSGDIIGHLGQQLVALLARQVALGDDMVEGNLDVDLVVGTVHTGGVVHRVGVERDAMTSSFDPSQLGQAKVAAFANDLRAQVPTVHANGVVGLVADIDVGLTRRFDIGADTTVPEQVDRRGEDGPQ